MTATADNEELSYLVASLDDLDREFAAGDLDQDDYDTLRNDYTVRIADQMRRRNHQKVPEGDEPKPSMSRARRWALIAAAVGIFAVGAGFAVARSAGERGVRDGLTGSINESARQRTFECQQLWTSGETLASLQCLDEVLTTDPDNVEALTYRGWYLVLTATSLTDDDGLPTDQAVELMASAMTYLDRAVEVDPTFPDARAFRAVAFDRLGQSELACQEVDTLLALDPPPFYVQQTAPLAERNGC